MNPAVVQIHKRTSTVRHACADRTLDIIRAATADANFMGGPGEGPKTRLCRDCKLRRALWWFEFEYGLDKYARVVPLEASATERSTPSRTQEDGPEVVALASGAGNNAQSDPAASGPSSPERGDAT